MNCPHCKKELPATAGLPVKVLAKIREAAQDIIEIIDRVLARRT